MATFRGRIGSPEELGDAIRQGREIQGRSQRELAARLGVTQKWLWELEQGKPGLLMERLFAALRAVDVTLLAEFDDPQFDRPEPDDAHADDARLDDARLDDAHVDDAQVDGHPQDMPPHAPRLDGPAPS